MSSEDSRPLHVQVAEKIIEQLKAGTAPWQKPWSPTTDTRFMLPYNATTGNRYKGINIFSLLSTPYDDPRWMTYNQASSKEWQVRKGEKGSLIQFIKLSDLQTKRDENGKPVLDDQGHPVKISVKLKNPFVTSAVVFNAAQVDGIPELQPVQPRSRLWDPVQRAEELVENSGANINHRAGNRAFYRPSTDSITMPLQEQFDAPDKYYSTLLHELGHWTGHSSRLDRTIMNQFGTEAYAREELRAEIASMLIGQEYNLGHDPGQHAAYVKSWIKVLEDNPFEIHAAAADAERIFSYLSDLEQKRELNLEMPTNLRDVKKNGTSDFLSFSDEIPYKDGMYKVLGHLKRGRLRMEEQSTGRHFILSHTDALYNNLLIAKREMQVVQKPVLQITETIGSVPHNPLKR